MQYPDRQIIRPGTTRRGRLVGFDYSNPGCYFVTICTHNRACVLGKISDDAMSLSPAGQMVHNLIAECPQQFRTLTIDAFVVMPNHVHMLVGLSIRLTDEPNVDDIRDVVKWLKNTAVRRYGLGVQQQQWPPYDGRLWQKGFQDHIVRNEKEMETIRRYVATNVESWEKDTFYDGFQDW